MSNALVFLFLLNVFSSAYAQVHEDLREVKVLGHLDDELPLSHINKDSIVKKEVLSEDRISHKNANDLSGALDLEPGVQTNISCASCGSKRVTLNGLRGENTTVLIDGLPAFSSVSSFYGLEALPLTGLNHIEIMRGAGASLTAPEAIGGVVNLVTKKPDEKSFSYQVKGGGQDYLNQQILGSYGNFTGGTLIAAQTNHLGYFDEDNNKVAESARKSQKSFMLKNEKRLSGKLKYSARIGHDELELIGGTTEHFRPKGEPSLLADEDDFENGDIRNRFNGDKSKITDWIRLKRSSGAFSLMYHLSENLNVKASTSYARQQQLSIYSHGYDYDNQDDFRFYEVKFNYALNEDHFFTFGVDHKNESMSSESDYLYRNQNFYRDSFDYNTLGFFIQDEWFVTSKDQLSLILRLDHIDVKWQDARLSNDQLSKTAFAPRLHYKRQHSDTLSSRFSLGAGYRAPLTLFESQHGTNEEGFDLDINELERAENMTYTLNHETSQNNSALSFSHTILHHMAYAEDNDSPLLFQNSSQSFAISTLNLIHVKKVTNNWTLEFSFDYFFMEDEYKEKLPSAVQESRARVVSDYHFGKSEVVGFLNIIGPRNLKKYDYEKNYNQLTEDSFTFEDIPSQRKQQYAPLYATVDLFYNYQFNNKYSVIAGVDNLFDYTQKESPLSWRGHGDHFHLDNRHIWGPLQGRVVYTGFKASF